MSQRNKTNTDSIAMYALGKIAATSNQEALWGFKKLYKHPEFIAMIDLYELAYTVLGHDNDFVNRVIPFINHIVDIDIDFGKAKIEVNNDGMIIFDSHYIDLLDTIPTIWLIQEHIILVPCQSTQYWIKVFNTWQFIDGNIPLGSQHRELCEAIFIEFIVGLKRFYMLPEHNAINGDKHLDEYCSTFWMSKSELINTQQPSNSIN